MRTREEGVQNLKKFAESYKCHPKRHRRRLGKIAEHLTDPANVWGHKMEWRLPLSLLTMALDSLTLFLRLYVDTNVFVISVNSSDLNAKESMNQVINQVQKALIR